MYNYIYRHVFTRTKVVGSKIEKCKQFCLAAGFGTLAGMSLLLLNFVVIRWWFRHFHFIMSLLFRYFKQICVANSLHERACSCTLEFHQGPGTPGFISATTLFQELIGHCHMQTCHIGPCGSRTLMEDPMYWPSFRSWSPGQELPYPSRVLVLCGGLA